MDISIAFQKLQEIGLHTGLVRLLKKLRSYDGKMIAVRDENNPNSLFVGKMIVEENNNQVYFLNIQDGKDVITKPFRYDQVVEFFVEPLN